MGTSYKGNNLSPFPLRAVPYGTENHVNPIRRPPLNVTIFITHVRNCVMEATPMSYVLRMKCWPQVV